MDQLEKELMKHEEEMHDETTELQRLLEFQDEEELQEDDLPF